jgi:nitrous oxidase accessory protein NosD
MNGGAISFDLNCTGCAGSIVEGNTFEDNLGGHTAGIYSVNGDGPITIRDNTFTGQTSQHTIYFSGTTLELETNTFDGNSSSVACVSITSSSTASGNVIVSDVADGIVADGATLTNNTVAGCATGISVTNGSASNNIAYANETGIVCGNSALQCNNAFGNAVADYDTSACAGLTASNIALDPLFCGAETSDFTLASESPCAPANAGACGLIGALPVSCTATGVAAGRSEPATWSRVKTLFR